MGSEYTPLHAAACAACLPPESAVIKALAPESSDWNVSDHLLAGVLDTLRWIAWTKTADAEKNRNRPEPIPRPGQQAPQSEVQAVTVEELQEILNRPRT